MPSGKLRIAVAQIDYAPAFLSRSVSYLREPAFLDAGENGLSALVQFPQLQVVRNRVKSAWIQHTRDKVEAILKFCALHKVHILIFPEYSIPVEILPLLSQTANDCSLIVVAGSHTVSAEDEAQRIYGAIGLDRLNLQPTDPNSDVRKSISPVFAPRSAPLVVEKTVKSVWETDMTTGRAAPLLSVNSPCGPVRMAVLLCIDALVLDRLGSVYATPPDLLVVPSLSRTTSHFEKVADLSLLNEVPCAYANSALYGGSRIVGRSGTALHDWPMQKDGTEGLPADTEAVVIADMSLEERAETRGTVHSHSGVDVVAYAPLLYPAASEFSGSFPLLRRRCLESLTAPIAVDAREQLDVLARTDRLLFPGLLQDKVRRLLDCAARGVVRADDIRFFLETVDLRADVCPTFLLRQKLIRYALDEVVGLLRSPDSVGEEERIHKVIRNLTKHRTRLPHQLASACTDVLSATPPPAPDVAAAGTLPDAQAIAFFDRQPELNLIRQFVNNRDLRGFILEGMRGIGKTALVRRVFVEVLPGWRAAWIPIPEGVSFEQLVATCANSLDMPSATIPTREEGLSLARAVRSRLDSLDAASLVFDDCQNLLGTAGVFSDEDTLQWLTALLVTAGRKNSKVFLISNSSLPLTITTLKTVTCRQARGLFPQDSRNLLDYWTRVQHEEMRGEPTDVPEKLISFLQGHPLAIRIAARLCSSYRPEVLIGDLSIFKKLREAIAAVLLDRVVLLDSQRALMTFASIFRAGVPLELFRRWGGDAAIVELESVLAKFLLDFSDGLYWMHPAVAQYFYEQAHDAKRRKHHALAGEYFLRVYERGKPRSIAMLIEAIHHVAASGDIARARGLGIHKDQLRVLARAAYSRRDWETALSYYQAISQIDHTDSDAQAHVALCLGRLARWLDAERHFKLAIKSKEAAWMFQAFGAIKANAGLVHEAEELLDRALDLDHRHSPTLASLASLRLGQHRDSEAEELFKEALEYNPHNVYALQGYGKFLIDRGRKQEARPLVELACELEPRDPRVRDLFRKLDM